MIGLWDTTGNEVVKALAAERRNAGGVTSGIALTLVAVVDEKHVREAEAAATIAASAHPARMLLVVRSDVMREQSRLDAEIIVGGRLGPCEAVVMRMYGRLALHAESVVMPLLAPDSPVVTWWHGEPPEEIAHDFLGVVADRRITDSAQAADPVAALRQRARDYAPGDTDLAWTRITLWRTLVAGAFDTSEAKVTGATVVAPPSDPTAVLMSGWLANRLSITPKLVPTDAYPRLREVTLTCANGDELTLTREDGSATFRRTGQDERTLPLVRRPLGDELAEELRRLDPDQVYAEALGTATGVRDLDRRSPTRVHVWRDPALAAAAGNGRPEAPPDGSAAGTGDPSGRRDAGGSASQAGTAGAASSVPHPAEEGHTPPAGRARRGDHGGQSEPWA